MEVTTDPQNNGHKSNNFELNICTIIDPVHGTDNQYNNLYSQLEPSETAVEEI